MNNRVFWGAIALAVAGILAAASIGDAARRMPNRDGVLIAGHDGVDQQIAYIDDTGTQRMGGNVASGATDSGNPVKVGGRYNATKPTLTDGQRGDLQLGTRGSLKVTIGAPDAASYAAAESPSDGNNNLDVGLLTYAEMGQFNGTTWDRQRGNTDNTLLASAARTTTNQSADQTNYNGRCVHVVLSVTSAGTGSITLTIQGKDSVSSAYYTILAGAAVTTNSTNVYKVCPGITAAANVSASDLLPRTWRVDVTHNNANSITYSVGASVSAN